MLRNDPDICPWHRIDWFNIDDYYGHMYSASIAELKAQASAILRRVKAGEDVIVTDRGRPIARLTPYQGQITEGRLTELARQGLIALPTMPFPLDLLTRVLPTTQNSVAGALLEEREEGY